tara:strand:+ start:253 stop:924 length:672 start_codon:yes stop_codon:yes gene_type:complete
MKGEIKMRLPTMRLPSIVSCISSVRGHKNKKQSAIKKLRPRIEECKRTGRLYLHGLNLNNSDVEEILNYVTKENITVRKLDLGLNELTTLPELIGDLQSLEILDLVNNKLRTLPESIGRLQSLKQLDLGHNHLKTLPKSIGDLQSLEKLHLSFNRLFTLPDSIGDLQSLKELYLSYNYLIRLPDSIGQLQNLKEFYLSNNKDLDLKVPQEQFIRSIHDFYLPK